MSSDPEPSVEAANVQEVLQRVAELPISTWSYLWDRGEVRHLGPMAQDFHAAFGLGDDDRRIQVGDGLGVALAAIQALNELVQAQSAEIAQLRERVDRLIPPGHA